MEQRIYVPSYNNIHVYIYTYIYIVRKHFSSKDLRTIFMKVVTRCKM